MISRVAVTLFASAALVAAHGTVTGVVIGGQYYRGADNWASPGNKESPVRQFPQDTGYVKYQDVTWNMDIACGKEGYKGTPVVAKAPAGSEVKVRWGGDQGKDGKQWPHCEGTHVVYLAPCTNGDCRTFNPKDALWFKIYEAGLDPNQDPLQCPDGHTAWPNKGRWAQNIPFEQDSWFTYRLPKTIKAGQYLMRHELVSMHSAHLRGEPNGAQYYPSCIQIDVTGGGNAQPQGIPATKIYTEEDGILDIYKKSMTYKVPGPPVFKDDGSAAPAPAPPAPTSTKPASTSRPTPTNSKPVTTSVYVAAPAKPTGSKTCKPKRVKRDLHEETQELYDRALAGAHARRAHGDRTGHSF
ncbi:glycoside hydrolase family 61 protein [Ceratobasidium sp. AG-Ba]|nr:glycoside hydrolase family 61 protein [Ceratobasidium sp. AG-Ba]